MERSRGEGRVALILEFKRCSPRGSVAYLTPGEFLERTRGFADAFSVLVEPYWFCGSLELLPLFTPHAPVLAKDLVADARQLEAHARWGASATLLILDMLGWRLLGELYEQARGLGLEVLIETKSSREALEALSTFPEALVGINARDLNTLHMNPQRALEEVRKTAISKPSRGLLVAESGVDSPERAGALARAGADALLVGTWVMRDPRAPRLLAAAVGRRF